MTTGCFEAVKFRRHLLWIQQHSFTRVSVDDVNMFVLADNLGLRMFKLGGHK
jgi:hypothetical protein